MGYPENGFAGGTGSSEIATWGCGAIFPIVSNPFSPGSRRNLENFDSARIVISIGFVYQVNNRFLPLYLFN